MDVSEMDLVRRAAKGDGEALHRLIDEHGRRLFGVALALTGNSADAEDLVQETIVAAIPALGKFEGRSAFRTWLVGILARQAALARRKGRRGLPEPRLVEEGPVSSASDQRLDIAAALASLTPEHREVVVLREYEGMSYDEIAAALGVPRGTVESRLFRARQELKAGLKDYWEDA